MHTTVVVLSLVVILIFPHYSPLARKAYCEIIVKKFSVMVRSR